MMNEYPHFRHFKFILLRTLFHVKLTRTNGGRFIFVGNDDYSKVKDLTMATFIAIGIIAIVVTVWIFW